MSDHQKKRRSIEFELINTISSFMKEKVGRGPRDIKITIVKNMLIFFIYGVFSPLEKNLLKTEEGRNVVREGRRIYLEVTNEERLASYERVVGAKVVEHFEGWNLDSDAAVGVIIFDKEIE